MEKNDFYTFREYMNKIDTFLTASMEDYLEMIFRLSQKNGYTRMHELASALNVQPPAATRMVQKLADMKLIKYEKYGILMLEDLGNKMGSFLLMRHNTIESFLNILGVDEKDILEETEKMEHTINNNTLNCISIFVDFFKNNSSFLDAYNLFKSKDMLYSATPASKD